MACEYSDIKTNQEALECPDDQVISVKSSIYGTPNYYPENSCHQNPFYNANYVGQCGAEVKSSKSFIG